jgi:hypothetical protein
MIVRRLETDQAVAFALPLACGGNGFSRTLGLRKINKRMK